MDIRKYLEGNNENGTYQNLWDVDSIAFGGKFEPSDTYIRAEHQMKINRPNVWLKNWEKEQQSNKLGGRK